MTDIVTWMMVHWSQVIGIVFVQFSEQVYLNQSSTSTKKAFLSARTVALQKPTPFCIYMHQVRCQVYPVWK